MKQEKKRLVEGERREEEQMHGMEGESGSSERRECDMPLFMSLLTNASMDLTKKKKKEGTEEIKNNYKRSSFPYLP